jgi:hypothetical protein
VGDESEGEAGEHGAVKHGSRTVQDVQCMIKCKLYAQ